TSVRTLQTADFALQGIGLLQYSIGATACLSAMEAATEPSATGPTHVLPVTIRSTSETKSAQPWSALLASSEMDLIAAAFGSESESRLPRLGSRSQPTIIVSGVGGSARALFLAALQKRTGRQVVVLARSNQEIEEIQPDVEFFYSALNSGSSEWN